ncbi:MAG TPA: hypothetical protein VGM82_13300 [Gemmatimonadaceae bacterium]|jgi:hypothetical protein
MSNVNGKVYGLTAITRMRPLKTFGVRVTFLLIRVCLLPKAARGAVGGAMLGVAASILLALLPLVGLPNVLAREGAWIGAHGGLAWAAGVVINIVALAIGTAIVGSFYQPDWTLLGKIAKVQENLIELSFIHFARWVIIPRGAFPRLASSQPREQLHHDYFLFESNFNGDWEKYIGAFSQVVPFGMDNIWRWSVKYPGSRPISPFLDYIRNCQYDTDFLYSAYPGASTNDVRGALKLDTEFQKFLTTSSELPAEQFAQEWSRFLVRVQNCFSTTGMPYAAADAVRLPADFQLPSPLAEGTSV